MKLETTGKHTATPWYVENSADGRTGTRIRTDAVRLPKAQHGIQIARICRGMGWEEDAANAKFIALACNHHEELVVMLGKAERALRWAAQESTGRVKAEIVGGWLYHADQAASLITKIKGTK